MFQTCGEKYHLRMVQGWTPNRRSGALGFGGAIHEGLAEWHRSRNLDKAMLAIMKAWPEQMPTDDYRTKEKCLSVMAEYSKNYPSETWQVVQGPSGPFIEIPFTLETEMYLPCRLSWIGHPENHPDNCPGTSGDDGICDYCGRECEPIEYGGIFDGLIEFGSSVYVLEHKSTSQLGATYFNQFKPNNQVTGYVWAASKMSGRKVGGAMINAIGVYKAGKTKFERHLTSRYPEEIDEWLHNVYNVCVALKTTQLQHAWAKSTSACTLYGLCEFHSVCSLGREPERRKRLEMDYIIEPWDYEKRGGTEVPSGN